MLHCTRPRTELVLYTIYVHEMIHTNSQWELKQDVSPLTVLAVHSTEAWWTLAHITDEGVTSVGLADLTSSFVVAWVWMARACVEKKQGN